MSFNWQKCDIPDGLAAEFPLDLLSPLVEHPPSYYWNNDKQSRELCDTDQCFVVIPTYAMSVEDVALAKIAMARDLTETKWSQAVEVISADRTGLGIFI